MWIMHLYLQALSIVLISWEGRGWWVCWVSLVCVCLIPQAGFGYQALLFDVCSWGIKIGGDIILDLVGLSV